MFFKRIKTCILNGDGYIVCVISIFLIGCNSNEESSDSYVTPDLSLYEYKIPELTQDNWQTKSLTEVNIDQEIIENMMVWIEKGVYGPIDSIVIVKDGFLVHEGYFENNSRDKLNDLRSVSKSIISTLVGLAIDNGYIASVDEKVMPLFSEYDLSKNWHERKHDLSVRHLLTMSSGLDCNDTHLVSTGREAFMFESEDWLEFFLTLPSVRTAGSEFAYCAGSVVGLAGVIENTTQMKGIDFADEKLFQPLGITHYDWLKTNGDLLHPNGLFLRSRDMAKIGQVMLSGQWNGQYILSQDWIEEATSHQFYDADLDSFGYLWWRLSSQLPGIDNDLFYAHGKGGKSILVIPDLNTVIVITAQNYTRESLQINGQLVSDFIFPALK